MDTQTLVPSSKADLHLQFGETEEIGGDHYRAYVGPPNYYDLVGATQFNLLTLFGMRETSSLLDIGCGSLRGGRFAIMYLRPGRYFGIDPEDWAIKDGLQSHFGQEQVEKRKPSFVIDGDFSFEKFGRKFDFMIANSVFTHSPQWQIRQCMEKAKEVMVPQTVFLATFFETLDGTDYEGGEWLYPDIVRYRKETISAIVEGAGLKAHHFDWPHPFNQKWIAVTLPQVSLDVAQALSGHVYSYEATLERRRTQTTWPGSATE